MRFSFVKLLLFFVSLSSICYSAEETIRKDDPIAELPPSPRMMTIVTQPTFYVNGSDLILETECQCDIHITIKDDSNQIIFQKTLFDFAGVETITTTEEWRAGIYKAVLSWRGIITIQYFSIE